MNENDIYWSHVCFTSMKSRNERTFEYGLSHINDKSRIKQLRSIYEQFINEDPKTIKILNEQYKRIPIIIA